LQKRSHKLLASTLLHRHQGFCARRFELAFLFGSFQPDCNPLTYLKGSLRGHKLGGHNFSNSQFYIHAQIRKLQRCSRWTIWQYYTLGKLTHYLADAFTYPHNDHFPDTLMGHRRYESALRLHLKSYLACHALADQPLHQDFMDAIRQLHQQYMDTQSDISRDIHYIIKATALLMATCLPRPVSI